jgi:NADH-dependent peroxiredoxin subunit C
MIQIGQIIDDVIDDFEFEIYQNDEIKRTKFSNYDGMWLVLLFYPADFTFVCPTETSDPGYLPIGRSTAQSGDSERSC